MTIIINRINIYMYIFKNSGNKEEEKKFCEIRVMILGTGLTILTANITVEGRSFVLKNIYLQRERQKVMFGLLFPFP